MAFKKSLAVVVFALPFILASPRHRSAKRSCDFLEPIKKDLIENLFDNECGDGAHGALRLSFHDAIGFSPKLGGGGADGSIIIFNETELKDPGNVGIDEILDEMSPLYYKHANAISPGDFIQLAGALSLTVCPGAPKVKYYIGRPPPIAPAPKYTIPQPDNTTDELLAAFAAINFSPREFIALLASHSVAGADDFDGPHRGLPFDDTPGVFDTNFFIDVMLNGSIYPPDSTQLLPGVVTTAINGTMRLQSDFELARDSRTACIWQSFAVNQNLMTSQFAAAFFKMSLLGQAHNHNLIDCSSVIPQPPPLSKYKIELPPGQYHQDVEQSCEHRRFPKLRTAPGQAVYVSSIPQAGDSA